MKAVIYGIGKRFHKIFTDQELIKEIFVENDIEIVGSSDRTVGFEGQRFIYRGESLPVKKVDEFLKNDIKIIVTSKLYFEEIKQELCKIGYKENQIMLIDSLLDTYLDKVFLINKYIGKEGVEIGGPTDLFSNIYDKCISCDGVNFSGNTVWWKSHAKNYTYKNKILGKVWISDATDMCQIKDKKYDFVLSSNNLEHIANPLKALKEFSRIVKPDGTILVLVPEKTETFDHNRDYTTFEHLLEDYKSDTGEDDLSHLPDIIEKHDYSLDPECGGKQKFIERAKKNLENRCLHHHVFEEETLRKSYKFAGIKVTHVKRIMGNWMIIGEKNE